MEPLVFTGFYGSGKTIVGKLLAARKNYELIDLEDIKNDYSIINAKDYFLNSLSSKDKVFTLDNEYIKDIDFRNSIKEKAKVIYLKSSPYTIFNNLEKEFENHHFNKESFNENNISKLYNEMEPYYLEMASFTIDTDYKKIENVFSTALAIYNYINRIHCHIYIK